MCGFSGRLRLLPLVDDPASSGQAIHIGIKIDAGRAASYSRYAAGLRPLTGEDRHIYIGTDPNAPFWRRLSAGQGEAYYPTEPGVTYWWRVDLVEADGTVYPGSLWTFTTTPLSVWGASPADGARGVLTDSVLLWEAGRDALEHEVFLGENKADVAAGAASVSIGKTFGTGMYASGLLKDNTLYYWRVDTTDWFGAKTKAQYGPSGQRRQ